MERYVEPGWFTQRVFNPTVNGLTKLGISVWGSRELRVRGRTSGEWRSTPVNLLTVDGTQYLVAPRGITQWVKNLRVAHEGELRVGKKVEPFRAEELADAEKPPILRAYLKRWKAEVGVFFDGVGPDCHRRRVLASARSTRCSESRPTSPPERPERPVTRSFDRDVLPLGGAGVDLPRPADLRLGVLVAFFPVRDPAGEPADREEHGEHVRREAHGPVDEARVEVDVRIELPLDEELVGQRDLLELERDVEQRVLGPELVQHALGRRP